MHIYCKTKASSPSWKKQRLLYLFALFCIFLALFSTGAEAAEKKTTAPKVQVGKTFVSTTKITKKVLDSMDLTNVSKLMIVAHPDDETLWGGGHLAEGGYLVICLTNANTKRYGKTRAREFQKVIEKSGNRGIIMNYADHNPSGSGRSNWSKEKSKIKKDVMQLLSYKKWSVVVTHNKKGEYGHAHHIMTNRIVTECFTKKKIRGSKLMYFGDYYSKKKLEPVKKRLKRLNQKQIDMKKALVKYYKSQNTGRFCHMTPFENWKTVKKY